MQRGSRGDGLRVRPRPRGVLGRSAAGSERRGTRHSSASRPSRGGPGVPALGLRSRGGHVRGPGERNGCARLRPPAGLGRRGGRGKVTFRRGPGGALPGSPAPHAALQQQPAGGGRGAADPGAPR